MSESDSSVNVESSSFIQRLDHKIKAYRQELQAVKEYHQNQKESVSDRESDIPEVSRASPSTLLESFERLTLNEHPMNPSEVISNADRSSSIDIVAPSPGKNPSSGGANLSLDDDHESSVESGDHEDIDPIYLQPCNEYTEQYDNQDEESTPDDSDSLCNSIQYSEHTHILDVEPPTFSIYGDESVYDAPISHHGIARRRSKSLYQGQPLKSFDESGTGVKRFEGTIYEDDYLDRSYMSAPPEMHGYPRNNFYMSDEYGVRQYQSPFVERETKGSGLYQDEFDTIASRRSPSPRSLRTGVTDHRYRDHLTRSTHYNVSNGSSYDDLSLLRSRSPRIDRERLDTDLNKPYRSRTSQRESEPFQYDRDLSTQSYAFRDDVSSREGSIETPTRYSARNDEHARSQVNSPSPSSPNLRHQSNRSLLDRYDNDALRRSRSNVYDSISNSTYSPVRSPRNSRYHIFPRLTDSRRESHAPLSSAGSLQATRSLVSDRHRKNRYTISNIGDLRNDFRDNRSESRSSHLLDPSDTTSDLPPRKLNEVKFEIFRAVHRVKMALESLAEDNRAYPILSEIQGIQDLNEQALQTMIEQFECIHEMLGEGDGSVGPRRPISPLSDESYGRLISKEIIHGSSDDIGSRYARSEISSPHLYNRRLGQSSRLDRNSFNEPPLSPSPSSRISRWQNSVDDSKTSGSFASRLRGASTFEA
ncbi:hypothetical protein K493DRAFT_304950 [Basidiobolus meristosporus CBS 931.73]|uniref:Uncharacterized protein n=1 Tax=Basidiobolus meristosporus CBS 931.73 TaxID=1314790 RepID=A0A1Y1XX84_9FUNG|nr:hypothetical protein K493DRAFT_304950 [Basidiobolus meristosporus CBS 931.73]|eukprot:ORX90368.1 hypothetical protein K493DRAFT_304950 [Basidiobolus meristosporus CBS 931.73]